MTKNLSPDAIAKIVKTASKLVGAPLNYGFTDVRDVSMLQISDENSLHEFDLRLLSKLGESASAHEIAHCMSSRFPKN